MCDTLRIKAHFPRKGDDVRRVQTILWVVERERAYPCLRLNQCAVMKRLCERERKKGIDKDKDKEGEVQHTWLACPLTWPLGTRIATHTAPFSLFPFPIISNTHTSFGSPIEKLSPSLAYPYLETRSAMLPIASRAVRDRWSVIQIRLP